VVWLLAGHCWLTRGRRLRECMAGSIKWDSTAAHSSNSHISYRESSHGQSSTVGLKGSIVLSTLPSRVEQTVRRIETNLQRADRYMSERKKNGNDCPKFPRRCQLRLRLIHRSLCQGCHNLASDIVALLSNNRPAWSVVRLEFVRRNSTSAIVVSESVHYTSVVSVKFLGIRMLR